MAPYPTPPKATFTLDARLDWKLEPRSTDNESPPSKSPAEERAAASMFIGICLAVTFVLAAPIVWVWLADRIRRRKLDPFRKLRDLERERKRPGIDPPPYAKAPPKDSIWARQEKYATKKPPRAITADQILGIDKRSYLERIVPQSGWSTPCFVLELPLTCRYRRIITTTHRSACTLWLGWTSRHFFGGRAIHQPMGRRAYPESSHFSMAPKETTIPKRHQ